MRHNIDFFMTAFPKQKGLMVDTWFAVLLMFSAFTGCNGPAAVPEDDAGNPMVLWYNEPADSSSKGAMKRHNSWQTASFPAMQARTTTMECVTSLWGTWKSSSPILRP
jgi:hypothetical protein